MDGILEPFGTWAMVLLGGIVLASVAVLVPIAVIFSLRVLESAITGFGQALRDGHGRLMTRADRRGCMPGALPRAGSVGRPITERRTDT
jgi:hypothetical protein